jgi:protein-tyrosine phosphatase
MKKILFVCLGNICRSPAAEGVFLNLLGKNNLLDKYVVDSAGTIGNHVGELPDERTRQSASQRGIELTSHSRKLEVTDLQKYDYIICMDKKNVEDVKKLDPENRYKDKIKLFTDFKINLKHDEVPDPYWGTEKDFELVMDIVTDASLGLLKFLGEKI